VPGNGFSFGALRYLSDRPEIVESLKSLPARQVQFLYRGRSEQEFSNEIFGFTSETVAPLVDGENQRQHLLEINSYFANGLFTVTWRFSRNFHMRSTIEALAQNFLDSLTQLITHCRTADSSSFTPSDFPDAGINQSALDKLMNKINLKD
jgi:non-ribosomal peptide synthase protein (TIGR01720 family)